MFAPAVSFFNKNEKYPSKCINSFFYHRCYKKLLPRHQTASESWVFRLDLEDDTQKVSPLSLSLSLWGCQSLSVLCLHCCPWRREVYLDTAVRSEGKVLNCSCSAMRKEQKGLFYHWQTEFVHRLCCYSCSFLITLHLGIILHICNPAWLCFCFCSLHFISVFFLFLSCICRWLDYWFCYHYTTGELRRGLFNHRSEIIDRMWNKQLYGLQWSVMPRFTIQGYKSISEILKVSGCVRPFIDADCVFLADMIFLSFLYFWQIVFFFLVQLIPLDTQ